ncbi:MAG: hypothetical protein ABI376_11705 [Caulobacteraceae bacterium]
MDEAASGGLSRPGPPRARMTFRVGVVGHRPDRLPRDAAGLEAIRERVATVLGAVAEAVEVFRAGPDAGLYSREAPLLQANSPLAEGADRLFADEALLLGYELCCVMPFAQAEFEEDFTGPGAFDPDALERFRAILSRAGVTGGLTRFELDGNGARRAEGYEAAGRVILNQSDLLLAVWDGAGANGAGGTVDTLRDAITFNVPVLWIDSKAPWGWRLLRSQSDIDCLTIGVECAANFVTDDPRTGRGALVDAVAAVVNEELRAPNAPIDAVAAVVDDELPTAGDDAENQAHVRESLGETRPRLNLAFVWKMFRDLLADGRLHIPRLRVNDFVDQISDDWPVSDLSDPAATGFGASWINSVLRPHYAWSDKLADRYADAHRSAFVWSSLLAATAVFVALLPMAAAWTQRPRLSVSTALVEATILGFMLGLPWFSRRRRWHQRWTEYRVLAELIRELRILIPLGGGRPLPRTPAHLANYGDPTRSWMYWQVRAIARATGLPDARVTPAYVDDLLNQLSDFVGSRGNDRRGATGQIGFHHNNCRRMERIHRRLHQGALYLFTLSIAGVVINWIYPLTHEEPAWVARWLIMISAFFPALGAALASINNQGEFARLQRRSRAMTEGFKGLKARIDALRAKPGEATLGEVTELAARMAAMMVDENIDWRIVVLDLPHASG